MLAGFDRTGFDNVRLWQNQGFEFLLQVAVVWVQEWCPHLLKGELLKFGAIALVMVSLI